MFDPQNPAETAPPDPHAARTERHLRTLQELAEIGMDLARLVRRQAMDADPETARADPGLTFARIARAVRQTVALEARLDEDGQARDKRIAAERAAHEARLAQAVRRQGSSRKLRAALLVEQLIGKVGDPEEEGSQAERLGDDLREWLFDDREDETFADRPIGEMVMEICRDLGLTPDWSLWPNEDRAVEMANAAASPDDTGQGPPPDESAIPDGSGGFDVGDRPRQSCSAQSP